MNSELKSSNKRMMTGYVVSDQTDKTIVVRAETLVQHSLYKKYVRRRKNLMAHDPANDCKVGDKVQVIEHRPLSRRKRWHLHKILEKAV